MEFHKQNSGTPQNVSTTAVIFGKNNVDDLIKELTFLQSENTILKGRIRGFDTLGTLLQEAKKANRNLIEQKNKLQQRLDDSIGNMEKNPIPATGEVITSLSDINRIYKPVEMSLTKMSDDTKEQANVPMTIPTQESMTQPMAINESGIASSTSSDSFVLRRSGLELSEGTEMAFENDQFEENIEYDSDKFQEAGYSKNFASLNINSFSDPSFSHLVSSNSGTGSRLDSWNQDIQIPMPRFLPSGGEEHVETMPSLTVSGTDGNLLGEMKLMMNRISKVQNENEKYKKLIKFITNESGVLKTQVASLKDENGKLLKRIKQLEHARDDLSPEYLLADNTEWVHVNAKPNKSSKEDEVKQSTAGYDSSKKIKELKEANNAWRSKWNSLERQYSTKNQNLEKKLQALQNQIKQSTKSQEDAQVEMDRLLLSVKKRAEDEEDAKEEAEKNLHMANHALSELKKKLEQVETELSNVKRAKQSVDAELAVIKNIGKNTVSGDGRTIQDKDTEIAVLKQQIMLCTEDFERERQDRAIAQTAKTAIDEENRKLKMDKQNLNGHINRMTQQIQEMEINRRRIQTDNENHQTHIRTLKTEITRLMKKATSQPVVSGNTYRGTSSTMRTLSHEPALEHLPGAWTCNQCTFINYPGRTVCEICGYVSVQSDYGNNRLQDLQPRGPLDQRDIEIDTCH